jgi:hypothetical protein
MRELSLHILDIIENSVKAKSTLIEAEVNVKDDYLYIIIKDNGVGMDKEFLAKVIDPFTTTRTTRNVGLGIPLLKQAAEMAEGKFDIQSVLGEGTILNASFKLDSIDRMPLGNLVETIMTVLNPKIDFVWKYSINDNEFIFDTREVKKELDGIPIDSLEIMVFLKDYLKENIERINGGIIL